ncbi:MAG: PilW family protein [Bacteroidales bacterium]|nr:PilW family protein [Bacteroidales bacterium]
MQSAQPIIEGIQSIQYEYGRDTDEDGSADILMIARPAQHWIGQM